MVAPRSPHAAICKIIHSKCKICAEREEDEPLANDQRHIAYADEFDHDDHYRRIPDAHAGQRKVARRIGLVDPLYLKQDVDVQGDVGKEREQV